MSIFNFIHRSLDTDSKKPKLVSEEIAISSVNDEFNQYVQYYIDLIRNNSKGVVLVVEDDPICSKIIEKAIGDFNNNLTVLTATSEAQALKLLRSMPCDLVICDYYLEGVGTGLDLCRKVSVTFPKTKCVMMSNMGFFKYREITTDADLTPEFMQKPIAPSLIRKYLTSFFENV